MQKIRLAFCEYPRRQDACKIFDRRMIRVSDRMCSWLMKNENSRLPRAAVARVCEIMIRRTTIRDACTRCPMKYVRSIRQRWRNTRLKVGCVCLGRGIWIVERSGKMRKHSFGEIGKIVVPVLEPVIENIFSIF